jgi:phosphatidylserine/phosphatidylglycerophosphate/cardiolipin synthase-like enzyme
MERRETHYPRSILFGGLAFGLGGVIGIFALYFMLRSELLQYPLIIIPEEQSLVLLIGAITLLVLGIGLTTGLGGALGGYALSSIDPIYPRGNYIWRTAIAAGVTQAILIIPLILLTALIALYNNGLDRDFTGQVIVFGVYGVIFGIVFGLILGLTTLDWRQVWRILLATITGFGLGGAAIGYGLWVAYYPATLGEPLPSFLVVLPILSIVFFGFGGIFIGWVYEWVTHWRVDNVPDEPARWVKIAGVLAALIIAFFLTSNYRQLIKFLTIRPGSLSSQISMETVGVHWEDVAGLTHQISSQRKSTYGASANISGLGNATWMEDDNQGFSEIFLSNQVRSDSDTIQWTTPISVSRSPGVNSSHPEITTDEDGNIHVVWTEEFEGSSEIFYSTCEGDVCSQPLQLSGISGFTCEGLESGDLSAFNDWPVIAQSDENSIMVMWGNASDALVYSFWDINQVPPPAPTSCFASPRIGGEKIGQIQPRLSGGSNGSINAVFSVDESRDETVYSMEYFGQEWSRPQSIASGTMPDVFTDSSGNAFYTWCSSDRQVQVKDPETALTETIEFPPCSSRPMMAEGENGDLHLVWFSDQVKNNNNVVSTASIVYESIRTDQGWSDPAIVTQTEDFSAPVIAGNGSGALTILWSENSDTSLYTAVQPIYRCLGSDLTNIGNVILGVAQSGNYRPEGDTIPYCENNFIGLVYMPNPDPAYSPLQPTVNGGFDTMSDLASLVEYEVLLSVMEWASEEDGEDLNPGYVFTNEIANLYQQIQENPSRYPRGLTVRILLGNYPELSNLEWGEQIWNVINDLSKAGVDKMVDSDIGWKVEVANFEGVYPHSHTKFLIIDGKLMVSAGYNYGYLHFPFDHPSNKGGDLFDLGMIVSGPIVQQALVTFDDYWQGAEQLFCPDLSPDPEFLWTRDCVRSEAQATHVPEVMKYYLPHAPGELSNAFSLNRNINFKESDDVISEVLESAQESLDIMEVNFSLELICMLDLLNDDVCSYDNALDYMKAIMTSVEENQTRVRVLVEKVNSNGMENRISAKEFTRELEKRGLSEYVEIKFFEGRMHAKAFLVDEEMLFVGSQNFHYSAWGEAGLAEYNLATDDPRAVQTFKTMFDYYWESGIPWEEYK